jgi:hypothetical protein
MFFDSDHEFSDFILQVESTLNLLTKKLKTIPVSPDDKLALTDLCKKVKDTIPYQFAGMKTQTVLLNPSIELAEFLINFKKLHKYFDILLSVTTTKLKDTSIKMFLHWKKLAEEGNTKAKEIYENMKNEFPDITKHIEDNYNSDSFSKPDNLN